MNKSYSDEFKLAVVKEYYEGNLGIRLIAQKYNLPSKNYITNWINQLKSKGLIAKDAHVLRVSSTSQAKANKISNKTPYEKELEKRLQETEAKLAFYQKCEELLKNSKKK